MCEVRFGTGTLQSVGISMEEEQKIAPQEEMVLFSSNPEGAEPDSADPGIEDLNRIVTSVALWSLLGVYSGKGSSGRLGPAFAGAVIGLGYSVIATGLTRFLKGPGAPSPFLIWGSTLVAGVAFMCSGRD